MIYVEKTKEHTTVGKLIESLSKHPTNMRVVVKGYEGGVDDLRKIKEIPIKLNANDEWCYGAHDECDEHEKDETALLIG